MFEKYMEYDDDRVRIQFSDGRIATGFLAGHYYGDEDSDFFYIKEWDFVECEDTEDEEDCLETKKHIKIHQSDIDAVYFYADKAILKTQ